MPHSESLSKTSPRSPHREIYPSDSGLFAHKRVTLVIKNEGVRDFAWPP